jgi:hypothetical protein
MVDDAASLPSLPPLADLPRQDPPLSDEEMFLTSATGVALPGRLAEALLVAIALELLVLIALLLAKL